MPFPATDPDWPYFSDSHRHLQRQADTWIEATLPALTDAAKSGSQLHAHCRQLASQLGLGGWLQYAVPAVNGPTTQFDSRALCLLRERLAYQAPLADFVFVMQALGSAPISLYGTTVQREQWLAGIRRGSLIAGFALSESCAGSDVAAMQTSAERQADGRWCLRGEKTWVSNGALADVLVVFARTSPLNSGQERSNQGITAFILPATTPGLEIVEEIHTLSPHPLARLRCNGCLLPDALRLGEPGQGFGIAMHTLDIFRPTVGAAALGMARRAADLALEHVRQRRLFGQYLSELPQTQATLAQMSAELDAAALLVYRAAWQQDKRGHATREAAMAKWVATEHAQRIIDAAVQLFGARGITQGEPIEALYRDIRALRIYEGASEIQQLVIARQLLKPTTQTQPAGQTPVKSSDP